MACVIRVKVGGGRMAVWQYGQTHSSPTASALSVEELARRYRSTKEPNERTWWQEWHMLWLLAQGRTATELSAVIGYRAYWIGQIAKR
jgi:hypothetical protein